MIVLEAENLQKSYFDPKSIDVIKNVSLTVHSGESIAICGRSGEGKTTLLHLLGTLEKPDKGQVRIKGALASFRNVCEIRRRHIGFIFQSFNLLEDFTALENVLMPFLISNSLGSTSSQIRDRALCALSDVGVADRAAHPAKLLSGGERQRVALARALFLDPSIIFADEPSGNLDKANAEKIKELLFHCVRQKGKSLVIATHDPSLAALCDRRYLLEEGLLKQILS